MFKNEMTTSTIAVYYTDTGGIDEKRAKLPGRTKSPGSAFGMSLLSFMYQRECGSVLPEIIEDERGKPVFRNRIDIHFSISHSRGHIICALSDLPVGADIEAKRPISEAVVERLTTERERSDFEFQELWVLRESFYKLTGTGDLRKIRFVRNGGRIYAPNPEVRCRLYVEIPNASVAVSTYYGVLPDVLTIIKPENIIK